MLDFLFRNREKENSSVLKIPSFPQPKSHREEVLLHLIVNGRVSCFDFPYMSGFRTRISDLVINDGLKLKTETRQAVNKFGNSFNYAVHHLQDRDQAINIYNSKR